MSLEEENNIKEREKNLPLKDKEIKGRLKDLKDWRLSSDGKKISRRIEFDNFQKAIGFVNELANFSERIDHRPATIIIHPEKVKVELTTSKVEGLTEKDFSLAKEVDIIADWKADFKSWLGSKKVVTVLLIIFLLALLWRYVL